MIHCILAFHSPCGYELPKKHLAATLAWVIGCGVRVTLSQIVLPGQTPQPTPDGVESIVFETSSVMFHKENLWNAAASRSNADKLFFLDGDVAFDCPDIFGQASSLLDEFDVCQPFSVASWLDREGRSFQARRSAAFAISRGYEPVPGYYHPGFAWCMTRDAFNRLGGFYDRHPFGGADVAFTYAVNPRWVGSRVPFYIPIDSQYWTSPSYRRYQHNGTSLGLKVGCLDGVTASHRWHGEIEDRQYVGRARHLTIPPGTEYPVHAREDGILEWDSQEYSDLVLRYFVSRKEDG